MISHRHRCLFLGVPKCASTSVREWLSTQGEGRPVVKPWWYGGVLQRRAQAEARVLNLYPDYFTFSFVRDPYERFVSLYLDASRRFAERHAGGSEVPAGLCIRDFAELCSELLGECGDLWGREAQAFFDTHGARAYGPQRIRLGHLGWLAFHALPQTRFLPDCNAATFCSASGASTPIRSRSSAWSTPSRRPFSGWRRSWGCPPPEPFAATRRDAAQAGRGASDTGRISTARRAGWWRRCTPPTSSSPAAASTARAAAPWRPAAGREAGRRAGGRAPPGRRSAGGAGRILARLRFRLSSLEVRLEARIRRSATARRILRPLRRLRGLPR